MDGASVCNYRGYKRDSRQSLKFSPGSISTPRNTGQAELFLSNSLFVHLEFGNDPLFLFELGTRLFTEFGIEQVVLVRAYERDRVLDVFDVVLRSGSRAEAKGRDIQCRTKDQSTREGKGKCQFVENCAQK